MGIIGKRGDTPKQETKLTELDILKCLNRDYLTQPKYLTNNLFVFGWESDYLAMTKSGYWYEIEIKTSRADFRNDFKKLKKHDTLKGLNGEHRPNYFYYCVPEGLISAEDVPDYAGLIYVTNGRYLSTIKAAPFLHKNKITAEQLSLADKFYYNYQSMLSASLEIKERVDKYKTKIAWCKAEFKAALGYDLEDVL